MKQFYAKISAFKNTTLAVLLLGFSASGQVEKPFQQRTSQYTPNQKIYSLKGDFALIGNTNLSLQNYAVDGQNGNSIMTYVDVDNPQLLGLNGLPTFNSSSAELLFSSENGAQPNCSNIVYAGLYWTGRASNEADSPMQFSVTKETQIGTEEFNHNYQLGHNQSIPGTAYNISVARQGSANDYAPRFTVSGGGTLYQFTFPNNVTNRIMLSVNGGTAQPLAATIQTVGTKKIATLTNPYQILNNGVSIRIQKIEREAGTNLGVTETINGGKIHLNVSGSTPIIESFTKNFDKRKIQFMGPGATSYTEFTANNNDIHFPVQTNDYMYSAYVEVTDYVRTHGLGKYTVADMALKEGNGGGTGYFGGWGLIVIYENAMMKNRDITLFDGYAYVAGNTTANFELPISGFNTVQTGPVGMKIGLISGEGDLEISGDYFQIQRQSDGVFQNLSNGNNSSENFFGSRIGTPGARTPNLENNTGIDLALIQVENPNNTVITNNQTSTVFRYGSAQDTFIINALIMAVDAYKPEIEGQLAAITVNGEPVASASDLTIIPGDEMEFTVHIRNRGNEPLSAAHVEIPIPFNTEYIVGSGSTQFFISPIPTPNQLQYQPNLGANGTLVWNIGDLPLPAYSNDILATLTFKLIATQNCSILQSSCSTQIQVNGTVGASGAYTGINSGNLSFVLGRENADCLNNVIPAPLDLALFTVDFIQANCQGVPTPIAFQFCQLEPVSITTVSGSFPLGTTFYDSYPVTSDSVQFTISNPFPAQSGIRTYYAIPPQPGNGCFYSFTIQMNPIESEPIVVENPTYCQGQSAQGLSATLSNPNLQLYYFDSENGQPQLSLIPSTQQMGVFTYYVAEGTTPECIGNKVAITVTVLGNGLLVPPADLNLENCGNETIVGGLPLSLQPSPISLQTFVALGGNAENSDPTIQYIDTISGTCPIQIVRTFSTMGSCGPISAVQNISIRDTQAPIFTSEHPTLVLGCQETIEFAQPTVSDLCQSQVPLTFADVETQGDCPGSRSITRTWTATDACGNASQISQTILIQDTTAPVLIHPAEDLVLSCDTDISSAIQQWLAHRANAQAQDECSEVTWTHNYTESQLSCAIHTTVTFTALDACGNSTQTTAQIRFEDNQAPVFNGTLEDIVLNCGEALPSAPELTALDSCSGLIVGIVTEVQQTGNCPSETHIVRTWTFTDACNNATTVQQNIYIRDTEGPLFEDPLLEFLANCQADVVFPEPAVYDTCGSDITLTFQDALIQDTCPNFQRIERTWTATDSCGNSSQLVQTALFMDKTAPVLVTPAEDLTFDCANDDTFNQWLDNHGNAQANDTCSDVVWTHNYNGDTLQCDVPLTVVFRATDGCGNFTETSASVIWNDTSPPTLPEIASEILVQCASEIPVASALTATDNCSGTLTVNPTEQIVSYQCENNQTIIRTWTFTDLCGNTSVATQTILVENTSNPVLPEIEPELHLSCVTAIPQPLNLFAVDPCTGQNIPSTHFDEMVQGDCPNSVIVVRTYQFTDGCGRQFTLVQDIFVNDNEAPVLESAPADITVNCGEIPPAAVLTAMDNCGELTPVLTETIIPGECESTYTLVRTWTATDACGNGSSVSQNIQVNSGGLPTFSETVAEELTVNCGEIPAIPVITAVNSCTNDSVEVTFLEHVETAPCPNTEMIIRTWTAVDSCGNQAHQTQLIYVVDTTAPVLADTLPAVIEVNCGEIPEAVAPVFVDNCSTEIQVEFQESTSETPDGIVTLTRVWTATDSCGNSSSATQQIVVRNQGEIRDASAYAACNIDTSLILDLYESLPEGIPQNGTFTDASDTGALQGNLFVPYNLETGYYEIEYSYSESACAEKVRIRVAVDDDCEVLNECEPLVHNAFSPNGDGKNDVFVISGFEDSNCITYNHVEIYNRWGVQVFSMDNYNNTTRAFKGYSQARATINSSEELPSGTYFYQIRYTKADGSTHEKDGYLYLSR